MMHQASKHQVTKLKTLILIYLLYIIFITNIHILYLILNVEFIFLQQTHFNI